MADGPKSPEVGRRGFLKRIGAAFGLVATGAVLNQAAQATAPAVKEAAGNLLDHTATEPGVNASEKGAYDTQMRDAKLSTAPEMPAGSSTDEKEKVGNRFYSTKPRPEGGLSDAEIMKQQQGIKPDAPKLVTDQVLNRTPIVPEGAVTPQTRNQP